MDVDQLAETENEDATTKMETVDTTRMEMNDTPVSAAPATAATIPTTTTGVLGRESNQSSAATSPLLQPPSSSMAAATSKPAPLPQVSRAPDRLSVPPATGNLNQTSSSYAGTPNNSSTGFLPRPQAPPRGVPGGSSMNWQQHPPGNNNHLKSVPQLNPPPPSQQSQGGILQLGRGGPPANIGAGAPTILGLSTGPGLLPRPSGGPILPTSGRSGSAGPAYPARPAAGPSVRFPSTANPVANLGDAAATSQGHLDLSNRKVALQGVPQTP